jgi:large subunit ribosomal protein L4
MKVDVYTTQGEKSGPIELAESVFGVPFNEALVHQAMVRQLANRRQGTADSLRRGEVNGSTRKLSAQKHTGRARRGDRRSPLLKGGGVAFGPHPRSYRQDMPKKMRRLALRCVLSAKARDGEIKILDKIELSGPRTQEMLGILIALGVDTSTLIATVEADGNMLISARNLEDVKTIPGNLLNVADLLSYKALIMTKDAVHKVEELWGQKSVKKATASGS